MNYDEIALNLINDWENETFEAECQKKANLQCKIIEALEMEALSCKRQFAGSVDQIEFARLKERESKCPTMLESEARALVRALQEIRDELGLMECASPRNIVEGVRRLKQNK